MPSHFSSIGFPLASQAALGELLERLVPEARRISSPRGDYLRYRAESGAELWLQLDAQGDVVGMSPHFAGSSRVRVGLTARVQRDEDSMLDGAFHGWVDPEGEDAESGMFPFVFDAPDAACRSEIALPALAQVQIAAFAHELSLFDSDEERTAGIPEGQLRYASQSFLPSGLFTSDGGPPRAQAVFTGFIRDAEVLPGRDGAAFQWLLVETLCATVDVVCDPELVTRVPRVGGLVTGCFWLSGRILEVHHKTS